MTKHYNAVDRENSEFSKALAMSRDSEAPYVAGQIFRSRDEFARNAERKNLAIIYSVDEVIRVGLNAKHINQVNDICKRLDDLQNEITDIKSLLLQFDNEIKNSLSALDYTANI